MDHTHSEDATPEEAAAAIALLALRASLPEPRPLRISPAALLPNLTRLDHAALVRELTKRPRVRRCRIDVTGAGVTLHCAPESDGSALALARNSAQFVRNLRREYGGSDEERSVLVDAAGEQLRVSWIALEAWAAGYSGDGTGSFDVDDPSAALAKGGVRAVVRVGLPPAVYTEFSVSPDPGGRWTR
jgi:hypothetical protein